VGDQSNANTGPTKARKAPGKKPGRPGLDAKGDNSVQIAFRVVPGVRKRAKEAADREGLTVSQLSRKALKQYLDTATPAK
jgi:predicted HicB family RNase H-like nuclease